VSEAKQKLRLDKWLWFSRFFKTRSLAATRVADGHVRVNGERVTKRATSVGAGDVLTFVQGDIVRTVKIVAVGTRRGPASEAQTLYKDFTPIPKPSDSIIAENPKFEGKGRPTKRDRRRSDLSRLRHLE
jgi:ribosome-associated heat shock protein Hsp15